MVMANAFESWKWDRPLPPAPDLADDLLSSSAAVRMALHGVRDCVAAVDRNVPVEM